MAGKIAESEIPNVLASLRKEFRTGDTLSLEWRLDQLKALKKLMEENTNQIIEAVHKDLGKHKLEIIASEINLVLGEIKHNISNVSSWMSPEKVYTPLASFPTTSYIYKNPLGVVLIMSPWNYPINLALVPLAGAISAGNCVLLKVSRHSSHCSELLTSLIPRYLDTKKIVVEGEGGASFITKLMEEKWDHVFFTGSVNVGRIIYQAAAKHLTPCVLELGGKNPVIVDDTIDINLAARKIAWGKFWNTGQTCIGVDHCFVLKSVQQKFVDALKAKVVEFFGEDPQKSESFGRIISKQHVERLSSYFKDGEVVIGGKSIVDERYVAPTILNNVTLDSGIMQEEIFGPILPIIPVDSIDQALDIISSKPKPLALYVFTANTSLAERVIHTTQSGSCLVNECLIQFTNGNLPFGGVGESGLGSYHGKLTFDVFSHQKAVMFGTTINWIDVPSKYPPFTDTAVKLIDTFTSLGGW